MHVIRRLLGYVDPDDLARVEAARTASRGPSHDRDLEFRKAVPRLVTPRRALALLAFVLVGLAISAGVWILRYQPLSPANSMGWGYEAGFIPGEPVPHVAFGIYNDGRLSVTVRRIEAPPGTSTLLSQSERDWNEFPSPFEPFELEPGATRWVAIASALPLCDERPGIVTLRSSVVVGFAVLGVGREVELTPGVERPAFASVAGRNCIAPAGSS